MPTSHANVHVGPSTGAVLLVMAARGTEFEVTGRDKEWIQVALTPDVRRAAPDHRDVVVKYAGRSALVSRRISITARRSARDSAAR